jgi:IS5 family transposase
VNDQIIAIYCLCDDYLKSTEFTQNRWHNEKMNDAEVMTVIIVASRFFYGNIERARLMLKEFSYIKKMLSKSRLNRRMHLIPDDIWEKLLEFSHQYSSYRYMEKDFIVDSFPISVCRNIRINRCRIFRTEDFRGYNASKKEYFYGVKATVITNLSGHPLKMIIAPGREHDLIALKVLDPRCLPKGSTLYGDAAYVDYEYEDQMLKEGIKMAVDRKNNSKRPYELEDYVNLKTHRKTIEGSLSAITNLMPKKIHSVSARGFELKIINFVIAAATIFCFN